MAYVLDSEIETPTRLTVCSRWQNSTSA